MATGSLAISLKNSKKTWFNGSAVQDYLARRKRIAFVRIGGFIRKVAQQSMPYRAGPSTAPMPPHSHRGLLRNFIFYSFDTVSDTLVVGPMKVIDGTLKTRPLSDGGSGQAPTGASVLEFGGRVERRLRSGRKSRFRIKQREYMLPALKRSIRYGRLRQAWSEIG